MGKDLSTEFSAIDTDYSQKGLSIKIRLRFGMLGHLTLFEVLNWINADKGCYAECEDMTDTAVAFAITRLGSIDYAGKVEEIFRYMLEIGYFDPEVYTKEHILTSEGIVKRWAKAKRRSGPETFDLPECVREILERLVTENAKSVTENAKHVTENAKSVTENRPLSKAKLREEKYSSKQTNKQTSAESSAEVSQAANRPEPFTESCPPAQPSPGTEPPPSRTFGDFAAEARGRDNWDHARNHAKEHLYFRGISADLIDAAAVCLVHGWVGTAGLRNIRRKARDALDVHDQSKGRRGKANGWETVRDCVSMVIREHGLDPPAYSRKNPEPPAAQRKQ